jgi:hypothetical protein
VSVGYEPPLAMEDSGIVCDSGWTDEAEIIESSPNPDCYGMPRG